MKIETLNLKSVATYAINRANGRTEHTILHELLERKAMKIHVIVMYFV